MLTDHDCGIAVQVQVRPAAGSARPAGWTLPLSSKTGAPSEIVRCRITERLAGAPLQLQGKSQGLGSISGSTQSAPESNADADDGTPSPMIRCPPLSSRWTLIPPSRSARRHPRTPRTGRACLRRAPPHRRAVRR
jgi:hypothetical protein